MPNIRQTLWKNYGFKDNPFDTAALSLYSTTNLPLKDAFVHPAYLVHQPPRKTGS